MSECPCDNCNHDENDELCVLFCEEFKKWIKNIDWKSLNDKN